MKDLTLINDLECIESRIVAEVTGKRHSDVIRDIRSMGKKLADANMRSLWVETNYKDSQGKPRKNYTMTKKGLMLLISKYDDNIRLRIIERLEFLERENRRLEAERKRMLELELSYAWNKSDIRDLYGRS